MHPIRRLAILAGLALSLAACATQSYYTSENLRHDGRAPRILMMPPDVELYELDATGNQDVNALWTRDAASNLTTGVQAYLDSRQTPFVTYAPPPDDSPEAARLDQVQKLHGAVGTTIRAFHFVQNNRLPAMGGRFDWSLGPQAQALGEHADADYALFVWVRDSYSTPGRVALRVMMAAFNVQLAGGQQLGHASLVDLRSGQVVWFNALHAREDGDLRDAGSARETVALLLDKLPK